MSYQSEVDLTRGVPSSTKPWTVPMTTLFAENESPKGA